MDNTSRKLILRLRDMFKRDDQTLQDFAAEVRRLTPEDKEDFIKQFEAMGLPTTLE